jgi:hypothetical protein
VTRGHVGRVVVCLYSVHLVPWLAELGVAYDAPLWDVFSATVLMAVVVAMVVVVVRVRLLAAG